MSGSGRNANHTDTQREASNVVPFPGPHARASSDARSDPPAPPAAQTDAAAGAGQRQREVQVPDQSPANGGFQEILGAESFWDGDAAWLHQPMAESSPAAAVPVREEVVHVAESSPVPEPQPAPPATAEQASAEHQSQSPRPPISRRHLLAWCGAVLAVLIVLGGVLPQLFPVRGHGQQLASAPLGAAHRHALATVSSRDTGNAAARGHADAAKHRDTPVRVRREGRRRTHHERPRSHGRRSTAVTGTPVADAQTASSGDGSEASSDGGGSTAADTYSGGDSSVAPTSTVSPAATGSSSGSSNSSAGSGGSLSCDGGTGTITPVGCRKNAAP
jgi:hypothetical protein